MRGYDFGDTRPRAASAFGADDDWTQPPQVDAPPETSFRRPGLDVALSQDRGGAKSLGVFVTTFEVGSACSPDPSSEAS